MRRHLVPAPRAALQQGPVRRLLLRHHQRPGGLQGCRRQGDQEVYRRGNADFISYLIKVVSLIGMHLNAVGRYSRLW